MAEHSLRETKDLALIFADQYNKENGMSFQWDEAKRIKGNQGGQVLSLKYNERAYLKVLRIAGRGNH